MYGIPTLRYPQPQGTLKQMPQVIFLQSGPQGQNWYLNCINIEEVLFF